MLVLLLWAFAIHWFAYRKGFYKFPVEDKNRLLITLFQLLGSFAIYLAIFYVGTPLFVSFLLKTFPTQNRFPIVFLTVMQAIGMVVPFCLIQSFLHSQNAGLLKKIWKDSTPPFSKSVEVDLGIGAITWFFSFPVVTFLGEIVDLFLKSLQGFKFYEQTAVKFVKLAMGSPLSLVFALFSVILMAPLIEEFLFRGLLLTYLKKRLGAKAAILLSALLFAFFHFSPSQGLGNASLLLSLFVLGGYLGFLYQKQGSLWAPIGLHMTFNTISALRILFLPEAV